MFERVSTTVKPEDIVDLKAIGLSSGRSPAIPIAEVDRWKEVVNLYHLIQQHCNHVAYFWFNYKWSIPVGDERVPMSTADAIKQGWYFDILRELHQGTVSPQAWVDAN